MWWDHGMTWEWMIVGGLMMLLVWGGLIALTVVVVRARSGAGSRQSADKVGSSALTPGTALDALKERYARGEITKAEYEDIRRDLTT